MSLCIHLFRVSSCPELLRSPELVFGAHHQSQNINHVLSDCKYRWFMQIIFIMIYKTVLNKYSGNTGQVFLLLTTGNDCIANVDLLYG